MNIIPLLSTIIVVATLATIVFAVASFVLFRIRERRQASPVQGVVNGQLMGEPQFFRVYRES
jgi:hypothetical protein